MMTQKLVYANVLSWLPGGRHESRVGITPCELEEAVFGRRSASTRNQIRKALNQARDEWNLVCNHVAEGRDGRYGRLRYCLPEGQAFRDATEWAKAVLGAGN